MWVGPKEEEDIIKTSQAEARLFNDYRKFFRDNPQKIEYALAHTSANPILSAEYITALAMLEVDPLADAVQELCDEYQTEYVIQQCEKWQNVHQKYGGEKIADDMVLGVTDVVTGQSQIGVWGFAMLDGIRESWNKWNPLPTSDSYVGNPIDGDYYEPRSMGRIWRYYEDLRRYDELLEAGVSPEIAQLNIAAVVRGTQVSGIGTKQGINEWREVLDSFKEAVDMAGENYGWTAAKKVMRGEKLNYDRENSFFFESLFAEEDPRYHELLKIHNGDEKKAKAIYYENVGTPIKRRDEGGELNYLSIENPNKIAFFADRRTNGNNNNILEYSQIERQKDSEILPYSFGRYEASQVFQPGTKAFQNASGILDFASALPAEYITGGILSIGKIVKGARSVDSISQMIRTRKAAGGRFLGNKEEALKYQDELLAAKDPSALNNLVDDISGEAKKIWNPKVKKQYKTDKKLLRRNGILGGYRPAVMRQGPGKVTALPESVMLFKALAKEKSKMRLMSNPSLEKMGLPPEVWQWVARQSDWTKIQKLFKDIMTDGITEVPRVGGISAKKLDKIVTLQSLPKGQRYLTGKAVRAVTGNEDFAMRSIGGVLGGLTAKGLTGAAKFTRNTLRMIKHGDPGVVSASRLQPWKKTKGLVDGEFDTWEVIKAMSDTGATDLEKILGFSSNFRAGMDPSIRRMLQVIPEGGLSLLNKKQATTQLVRHLQQNQYEVGVADKILDNWFSIGKDDVTGIKKFAVEQMTRDVNLVYKRQGEKKGKVIKDYVNTLLSDDGLIQSYFKSNGPDLETHHMPFPGAKYEEVILDLDVGKKVIQMPTMHITSEAADNYAPLLNHRMITRALSPLFDVMPEFDNLHFGDTLKHTVKNIGKYWKGSDDFSGFIATSSSHDKIMQDAVTNVLDIYTQNIFKPIVLFRPAFFTRIFLEEQARIYASGLNSIMNHPYRLLTWAMSYGQDGVKGRLGIKQGEDLNDLLQSQEYLEVLNRGWSLNNIQGEGFVKAKFRQYPDIKPGHPDYADGIIFELSMMRKDPITRKVAELGFEDDGKELIRWFLETEEGLAARKQLVKVGGRKFQSILKNDRDAIAYLESIEARIRMRTGHSLVDGKDYQRLLPDKSNLTTAKYSYKVNTTYEGQQYLRDAIATGKLDDITGDSLNFMPLLEDGTVKLLHKDERIAAIKSIQKRIDEQGLNLGIVKTQKALGEDNQWLNLYNTALDAFFRNVVTRPINYLNRSTTFKQYRWAYLQNNWHTYTPRLQKQLLKEAKAAKIPKTLRNDLKELQSIGGKLDDYDVVNNASKAFGVSATKELLYDITKRHKLSDVTRNIFPFPEVWFEMLTTWPRLLMENPMLARKAQLGIKGSRGANTIGFSGDGFFAEDPNGSGQEMFVYPFGGWMGNLIFGEDSNIKMSPRGFVTGVNLLGQGFVPGPTPLAGFAINKLLPSGGVADEFRSVFFGDFGPPGGNSFWDAIIPKNPSLQKGLAAIGWGEGMEESEIYRMRASTTIDIFKLLKMENADVRLLKEGKLDKYLANINWQGTTALKIKEEDSSLLLPEHIDTALLEYSKDKAKLTFAFRFLAQAVLPTGFTPRYFVEDKDGKIWGSQILAKEYQNLLEKHNENHVEAYKAFYRTYGYEHSWLTTSKTLSKEGKQSFTDRGIAFEKENKKVLENLPLSHYYLLPDNPYEERSYQEIMNQYNMGITESLTPEEYVRAVNDTTGYFRYTAFKSMYEKSPMPERQKDMLFGIRRRQLMQDLPGFQQKGGQIKPATSKEILAEMIKFWPNLKIAQTTESGRTFVNDFLPMWEKNVEVSKKLSPSGSPEWWLTSTDPRAVYMRANFSSWAEETIQKNPDFAAIWVNIVSRMFRDDTEIFGVED